MKHQLSIVSDEMREMRTAMNHLVALGERQNALIESMASANEQIKDHERRIRDLEISQPQLKETRGWVIAASAAGASAVLTFAIGAAITYMKPPPQQPTPPVATQRDTDPRRYYPN